MSPAPNGQAKPLAQSSLIELSEFPTTRYQGSKRKLVYWIWEGLRGIKFDTALDAFGGTASVSYLFKRMGKAVTYNDKLHFNYLVGKAIIENDEVILTDEDIDWLVRSHDNGCYTDFISDHFQGMYYMDHENRWLDMVNSNILQMVETDKKVLQYKQSLAYYALFQACLVKRPFNLFHRSNLGLRTSNVKRTFGNKVAWEKPFEILFRRFVQEANRLVISTDVRCSALNRSAFDIDPDGYDAVYLDPPYLRSTGSNETSDYFRCYHFLEGMSQYSDWASLLCARKQNTGSDFTLGSAHGIFEELLARFRHSVLIISYKRGGIPSIEFIVTCLKRLGKKVNTKSVHYSYALNHQNGDAKKNREVLIIGQ